MILQAPWPKLRATLILVHNPTFSNQEELVHTIDFKQTLNGTKYTYVRIADPRLYKLTYTFDNLSRATALELLNFYQAFCRQTILITDWESNKWLAKFDNDLLETAMSRRAYRIDYDPTNNMERMEAGAVSLEFRAESYG